MALSRYLLNELLDDVSIPFDRDLVIGSLPRKHLSLASLKPNYLRRLIEDSSEKNLSVRDQENRFKVNVDVQQFKPDEINVKVINDYVVIEGKHEERADKHGLISRQFTRRYKVPENVNLDAITSTISSDGILTIQAPRKIKAVENERNIPIVQTSQPAIKRARHETLNENSNESE